jgi:MSHA biogenesis protein MshK
MADRMIGRKIGAALAAALGFIVAGAQAQALVDPTRPPNFVAGAQSEAPAGNQLTSVLLSGGRKVAVINGATVPLGGMVGDARLVRISETEVALRKGSGIEVLKLYPGVDKKSVRRKAPRHGGSK